MKLKLVYEPALGGDKCEEKYSGVQTFSIRAAEAYGNTISVDLHIEQEGKIQSNIDKSFHVDSFEEICIEKE